MGRIKIVIVTFSVNCRSRAHAQEVHRLPRLEAGQHFAGRARTRQNIRLGPRVRLFQKEASRQCVS